jgi:hypothetical protein
VALLHVRVGSPKLTVGMGRVNFGAVNWRLLEWAVRSRPQKFLGLSEIEISGLRLRAPAVDTLSGGAGR